MGLFRFGMRERVEAYRDMITDKMAKYEGWRSLFTALWRTVKPEELTESSSTHSSDADETVNKRLIFRRRSDDPDGEDEEKVAARERTEHNIHLIKRFLSGLVLTQSLYLLLTYQSHWNAVEAAAWTGLFGFLVATGMAFSIGVRSVVFLMVPSFCTGKGRTILLTYSLMLLITGPANNIASNYREMSKSLTCGDELGYNVSQGLKSLVQDAQYAILDTMDDTVDIVIDAVETAEEIYQTFAKTVEGIGNVISRLNKFIHSMGDICAEKLGAFFCIIPNFVAKQAKHIITEPVKDAVKRIKAEFYFTFNYTHEFEYNTNASKSVADVSAAILTEVEAKIGRVTNVFDWVRFAMSFSTVFVVLKAIKYRIKYLTSDNFDNIYITDLFKHMDRKKYKHGQEVVLPLRAKETNVYLSPSRVCMSKPELKKFFKGISFVTFNFAYAAAVIFVDYAFWWMLYNLSVTLSLRESAGAMLEKMLNDGISAATNSIKAGLTVKNIYSTIMSLRVSGAGFVPIIYKAIASSLQRLASSEGYDLGIDKCLPNPSPPDYFTYIVIGSLFLACYIMCLLEGYVLRARRRIMASYYPERERSRILCLRRKILTKRGTLDRLAFKSAMRKAVDTVETGKETDKISLLFHLSNRTDAIGWIARNLTGRNAHRCSVCKLSGTKKDGALFTRCQRFGCNIEYCTECFNDLHRICPSCLMKHSKVHKRRRKKRKTDGEDETIKGVDSREEFDKMAESLLESSGISDSSDDKEDSDEEGLEEVLYPAPSHKLIQRSVRFEDDDREVDPKPSRVKSFKKLFSKKTKNLQNSE